MCVYIYVYICIYIYYPLQLWLSILLFLFYTNIRTYLTQNPHHNPCNPGNPVLDGYHSILWHSSSKIRGFRVHRYRYKRENIWDWTRTFIQQTTLFFSLQQQGFEAQGTLFEDSTTMNMFGRPTFKYPEMVMIRHDFDDAAPCGRHKWLVMFSHGIQFLGVYHFQSLKPFGDLSYSVTWCHLKH